MISPVSGSTIYMVDPCVCRDITFNGDSLIVEVATSELRKATGRRAPYQGQWRPGLASK